MKPHEFHNEEHKQFQANMEEAGYNYCPESTLQYNMQVSTDRKQSVWTGRDDFPVTIDESVATLMSGAIEKHIACDIAIIHR